MEDLAEAYLQILEKQKGKRKEFFGLRDFYRYVFSTWSCALYSYCNLSQMNNELEWIILDYQFKLVSADYFISTPPTSTIIVP